MAISTYAELQAAVGDFLNRDDLSAVIPSFIALTEADHTRKLRHWRMETRADITVGARYVDIPTGWLETVRFALTGYDGLTLASHADMARERVASLDTAGQPLEYAMTGGQFEFRPTPDADYAGEIVYLQQITPLSDAAPTNWLLTLAPDVYLYGALTQSAPYLKDDQRMAVWAALYQSALDGLNIESERAKQSGAGLRVKIRSF